MASSGGKSTSFRWELKNFHNLWQNNKNKDIISADYNEMKPFSFKIFFRRSTIFCIKSSYGVVLKNLGDKQSVEVSLKLWLENGQGKKFYIHSIDKYLFTKVEDRCKINVQKCVTDWALLSDIITHENKTLYICCEITIKGFTVATSDFTQQFHQNIERMYEQRVHDTIIKVGNAEFKISKLLFMAQSEVFKNMFTSDFKESKTNIVEIKDISEQAMEQLVKWMYTCQVDNQESIEDLFEVADQYQIHMLKTRCAELMINSLNNSNVFRRLILAVAHNDDQLEELCLFFIDNLSTFEVATYFTSFDWSVCTQEALVFIVGLNQKFKFCAEINEVMIKSLDNSNVFRRLILAVALKDKQLEDAALDQIDKMPKNEAMIYLVSPEWVEFVRKNHTISDEVRKAIAEKLEK